MLFKRRSTIFDLPAIIEGCRDKNPSSQRQLFDQYANFAKNICLRYAANDFEAEEMVSDGFLKVFNNIHKYDSSQAFEGWFRRVVVNTAIDYFRKNQARVMWTDMEHAEHISHTPEEVELISAEEILAFVQKLSPAYRTVFSLSVVDGYPTQEIAEMLQITEGAVRSNLAKARQKLQERINEYTSTSNVSTAKNHAKRYL